MRVSLIAICSHVSSISEGVPRCGSMLIVSETVSQGLEHLGVVILGAVWSSLTSLCRHAIEACVAHQTRSEAV